LRLVDLHAKPWFEWVETKANVADGGSREGVTDALAKEAGIDLQTFCFPPWSVAVRM